MKNNVYCCRCGKEFDFTKINIREEIKCPHCGQTMYTDKSTQIKVLSIKIIIHITLICLITIIAYFANVSLDGIFYYIFLLAYIVFMVVWNKNLDMISLLLLSKFGKVNYIKYDENQ